MLVFLSWLRLPPDTPQPGLGVSLESMWHRAFPTTPFGGAKPTGILYLLSAIHQDHLFSQCFQADQLTPHFFDPPNGRIKTVGDLYNFLSPCASATTSAPTAQTEGQ
jgi:hypothetical protein